MSEKKRLDPAKTRDSILAAALETFAEKGYSGASYGAIAKKAQVPKSSIQYHFGSKEELWQATVAHNAAPMFGALDRFIAGQSSFEELLEIRYKLLLERPEIGRLLAWASLSEVPFPKVMAERKQGLREHLVPANLFAIAALDGWFLFRNLYQNIAGPAVKDPKLAEQLLQTLKQMVASS